MLDAVENGAQGVLVGRTGYRDGKLVATHAAGDIRGSDDLGKYPGNVAKHLVAHRMAIRVVYALEVIEVDHEQREGLLAFDHGVDLHGECLAPHEVSQFVKI